VIRREIKKSMARDIEMRREIDGDMGETECNNVLCAS
jgi:hypothetical protein